MKSVKYSFIIPHFNCPDLLSRCLKSIPQREDVEIIVVDDNSLIENRPSITRKNLKIIFLGETDTHGAGHARNMGIMEAKGEWLIFADADDYYTENLNALLDKYSDDNETDLVYLNAQRIDEEGNTSPADVSFYIRNYKEKRFYSEKALRYNVWSPWTRMVKRKLVETFAIFYDNIPMGNDMMFSLKCSKYAKRFSVEDNIIYLYFNPIDRSVTEKNRRNIKNIHHKIELTLRQNELYNQVGYLFKGNFITGYRNVPVGADIIEYKAEYKNLLRKYKIPIVKDLVHLALYRMGLLLKIVR